MFNNKSVNSITKDLGKMVQKLRAHATEQDAKADALAEEANRLVEDSSIAIGEAAKAERVASRIEELLEA